MNDGLSLYEQYLICQQRGHRADWNSKEAVRPKEQCIYCLTIYWEERREENIPMPPTRLRKLKAPKDPIS